MRAILIPFLLTGTACSRPESGNAEQIAELRESFAAVVEPNGDHARQLLVSVLGASSLVMVLVLGAAFFQARATPILYLRRDRHGQPGG